MKEIDVDDLSKHPLIVLKEIAEKWGVHTFRLRSYQGSEYGSGWRDIAVRTIKAEDLLTSGLEFIKDAEVEGLDVAIESAITLKKDLEGRDPNEKLPTYHIPMIDFGVPVEGPEFSADEAIDVQRIVDALMGDPDGEQGKAGSFEAITSMRVNSLRFFKSGRSLHAYGTGGFMSEERWRKFMAELLIINPVPASDDPDDAKLDLVDARWVGRRLIQGSGSLRLTAQDDKYLQLPEMVEGVRLTQREEAPF